MWEPLKTLAMAAQISGPMKLDARGGEKIASTPFSDILDDEFLDDDDYPLCFKSSSGSFKAAPVLVKTAAKKAKVSSSRSRARISRVSKAKPPQLFDPRAVLARLKSLPNPASDSEVVCKAKKTLSFFKKIDLSSAFLCHKEFKEAISTLLAEDKKNPDGSSNLITLQRQFDELSTSFDKARIDLLETNDLLAKKEKLEHQELDFKETCCENLEDGSSHCGRIITMFEQEITELEDKLKEVKSKLLEAQVMQASIKRALSQAADGMLVGGKGERWLARKVEAEAKIYAAEKKWEEMKELIMDDFPPIKQSYS